MLDGYISDLEKGDVFRPVVFEVTPLMATEYAHGVEQTHELFHSNQNPLGRQVRPLTAVHADKMRVLDENCLKEQRIKGGRGPDWRIHYEHDTTVHAPVFVGDRIRVSGRIADRYWKRGREYLQYELEVHHEDGRLLISYRDKTLLRYRKHERSEEMTAEGWQDLEVGSTLTCTDRTMTEERLRWYGDGMLTSSAGEPVQVGTNIHTDDAYAQAEGLPKAIADGMLSANWLAGMLMDYFGEHYLTGSRFRVKFIKPVFVGSVLSSKGTVSSIERDDGVTTYHIDLSITDEEDIPRTVGEASVTVPSSAE